MKYHAPNERAYETGLSAKLMYSIADRLIKQNATNSDIQRLQDSGKIWMKPEIRGELDDFVDSYFFTDLKEPFLGIKQIILETDPQARRSKLVEYAAQLGQQYGSPEQGRAQTARVLNKLKERYDRACAETQKLKKLRGVKQLIKDNASDGFSHVFVRYGRIDIVIAELGALGQS